ncbi:PREDICTED: uncharacterized protein LOC105625738 [Atta cephalotes]|uniref:Uncharacterized protein n=1 Tax=Atta cephalotes TaxID=12957 RepID=A0A158NY41_ATTCE|nr:PREDICTED: uncharacterized protein LOC105625738 [Atta cephalotes]
MKSAGWTSRQREPVKFFESWAMKEGEDKRKRERRKSVGDGGAESERRSRRWSVEDGCAPSRLRVTLWKGRLYPAYSLSGSEGEDNTSSLRSRAYPQNNPTNQSHHNHYNTSQHKQRAYQQQQQHPLYHMPGSGAGLSDTPTSGNASDETLTDSDLITVARDSALLVHNGEYDNNSCKYSYGKFVSL